MALIFLNVVFIFLDVVLKAEAIKEKAGYVKPAGAPSCRDSAVEAELGQLCQRPALPEASWGEATNSTGVARWCGAQSAELMQSSASNPSRSRAVGPLAGA